MAGKSSSPVGRHVRVLRILRSLRSGLGCNAAQLAQELQVCRRTIFRDLDLMRQAGLDVCFDAELQGYRLAEEVAGMIPAPRLDEDELATLVFATRLSFVSGLPPFALRLRDATDKLLSGAPYAIRHSIARVLRSCSWQPASEDGSDNGLGALGQLIDAIRHRRVVVLEFAGTNASNERTNLAPYRIDYQADGWQVTGRSSLHQAVQTISVLSIFNIHLSDQTYAIPRRYIAAC